MYFSYDPESDYGPSDWSQLDTGNDDIENECGDELNSPIALSKSSCNQSLSADYTYSDNGDGTDSVCAENKSSVRMKFAINDHAVVASFVTAEDDDDDNND